MGAVGNTGVKFVLKINIIGREGREREGGREGDQGGFGETDIKEKIKVDNYLSITNIPPAQL